MDKDLLIIADNISKKFCKSLKKSLWYGVKDITAEALCSDGSKELRPDEFWAVNNVSFQLMRGQCLGLIGRNGAGKSTLLKMLNGLIKPTRGKIIIKGRVGALIELGSGFNPILTGRENIYINGAILGFTKKEIDQKLDGIIEFSEISDFIDTPLQSYSSGMKVRLGFAVAAQMEPDILIIDEILAVGDIGFRAKCVNKIKEIAQNAAIIFVSHNMPQVARISTHILLMERGNMICVDQNIPHCIDKYYEMVTEEKMVVSGSGEATLHESFIYERLEDRKKENNRITYLNDFIMELIFSINLNIKRFNIVIAFYDQKRRHVADIISANQNLSFDNNKEIHHIKILIPHLPFSTGRYKVTVGFIEAKNKDWGRLLARYQALKEFTVSGTKTSSYSPILFEAHWENLN